MYFYYFLFYYCSCLQFETFLFCYSLSNFLIIALSLQILHPNMQLHQLLSSRCHFGFVFIIICIKIRTFSAYLLHMHTLSRTLNLSLSLFSICYALLWAVGCANVLGCASRWPYVSSCYYLSIVVAIAMLLL